MAHFGFLLFAILLFHLSVEKIAAVEYEKSRTGKATYYDLSGTGACGKRLNAKTDQLVAISRKWFTTSNPNKDPYCKNVCVRVQYKNKPAITVPVRDKCPACDMNHLDLSKAAFNKLKTSAGQGVLENVKWKFVRC